MKRFNIEQLEYLNFGPMSLKINSTECIGLSGESGSGKSRLLRALADLDAHQGDINLDGMNMRDVNELFLNSVL